jgi:hypothetical protein
MLKLIVLFILLTLNSTSANDTLLNNSSLNNTLLNNSSLNNTLLNNSSLNNTLLNNSSLNNTLLNNSSLNNTLLNNTTSEDDWFNRSSNLSFALPHDLFSKGARIADAEQAGVEFPEGKPTTRNPIWDTYNPRDSYNPWEIFDPDPRMNLGPLDIFLGSGESGTFCSEDGICYDQFVD